MNTATDITISDDSVKCTIEINRPYSNDEEMLTAIQDIKALKEMLPKDEPKCDENVQVTV